MLCHFGHLLCASFGALPRAAPLSQNGCSLFCGAVDLHGRLVCSTCLVSPMLVCCCLSWRDVHFMGAYFQCEWAPELPKARCWSGADTRFVLANAFPLALQVREIRLVRREGRSSVCLVLLRFDAQPSADGFYRDFNGRPVSDDTLNDLAKASCPSNVLSMYAASSLYSGSLHSRPMGAMGC